MEASHLATMVRDITNVTIFWETSKKIGVCKTERITREYHFYLNNLLCGNNLKFDADLFTTTKDKTPACMLDLLKEQYLRMHWSTKKATDQEHGKDRSTLTGKIAGKSDDLSIATQTAAYWSRVILSDKSRLD